MEEHRLEKKLRKVLLFALIVLMATILLSCGAKNVQNYEVTDYEIFYDTPIWELAKFVESEDVESIKGFLNANPELIDYQENKFGVNLLMWSVGMEKYESAKVLLECGSDPNIQSFVDGETPLYQAAGFSWIDSDFDADSKFVRLLLKYGADPNITYGGLDESVLKSFVEPTSTPLMHSIGRGIDKTKSLVEAGANLNFSNENGMTVAVISLLHQNYIEYAHYLIVEKKAIVTEPYFYRSSFTKTDVSENFYPVWLLRKLIFDLDSEEYVMKMEIVEEFSRQGVDYWNTPILDTTLDRIKELYPEIWEEYVAKY